MNGIIWMSHDHSSSPTIIACLLGHHVWQSWIQLLKGFGSGVVVRTFYTCSRSGRSFLVLYPPPSWCNTFLSAWCLMNQLADSYGLPIYQLLNLLGLGDLDLIFKVTAVLKLSNLSTLSFLWYVMNQKQSYQFYTGISLGLDDELIRFWWPWHNSQGHCWTKTFLCDISWTGM